MLKTQLKNLTNLLTISKSTHHQYSQQTMLTQTFLQNEVNKVKQQMQPDMILNVVNISKMMEYIQSIVI